MKFFAHEALEPNAVNNNNNSAQPQSAWRDAQCDILLMEIVSYGHIVH